MAQEGNGHANTQHHAKIPKPILWIKNRLDSACMRGVEPQYIKIPEETWAVELRTTIGSAMMKMDTEWNFLDEHLEFSAKTDNGLAKAVGIKLSYRNTGVMLSKVFGKKSGTSFSINSATSRYGINFALKKYKSGTPEITIKAKLDGETTTEKGEEEMQTPISVSTQFLDAYYIFNNKHFSYVAANKPSHIQVKSAGSIIAGAMYYHAKTEFISNNLVNLYLTSIMHDIGKVKITQASIGAGYAYNWVPARGWLVSALVMPMATLYNRAKFYKYYSEATDILAEEFAEDPELKYDYESRGYEKTNNKVLINFDARMSIVYNYKNYFCMLRGTFNRFNYGRSNYKGYMADWSTLLSLGYRF